MAILQQLFMLPDAFNQYCSQFETLMGTERPGPLLIKVHTLMLDANGSYSHYRVKPAFYENLFAAWKSIRKASADETNKAGVFVKTAPSGSAAFPDFKLMIIASATGPELLMNSFEKSVIENKLGEIIEYIAELIETLNANTERPDLYALEIKTPFNGRPPALILQADITGSPDSKVRELLKDLPGWGRPISRAKPAKKKALEAVEEAPGIESEKYITYEIFYGTSRKRNKNSKPNNFYIAERADHLEMGTCNISIPKDHQTGKLERPGWFRNLFFGENPEKDITVLGVYPKDEAEFQQLLKNKLSGSTEKDALVFIHGFNVDFAESVRRAAQLGYDLDFNGAVIAFTWPSKGSVTSYITDLDSAKYSSFMLKEFLLKITADNTIERIFFIAHSMGNAVLTEALLLLAEEHKYPLRQMSQLVMAAPDVDQMLFRQSIAPAIIHAGGPRFTLYASSKDKALLVSQRIRDNYTRLGQGGEALFLYKGIDSVDASAVDTDLLGHGYFAETKQLIDDIHGVLQNIDPDDRKLNKEKKLINNETLDFWKF